MVPRSRSERMSANVLTYAFLVALDDHAVPDLGLLVGHNEGAQIQSFCVNGFIYILEIWLTKIKQFQLSASLSTMVRSGPRALHLSSPVAASPCRPARTPLRYRFAHHSHWSSVRTQTPSASRPPPGSSRFPQCSYSKGAWARPSGADTSQRSPGGRRTRRRRGPRSAVKHGGRRPYPRRFGSRRRRLAATPARVRPRTGKPKVALPACYAMPALCARGYRPRSFARAHCGRRVDGRGRHATTGLHRV